MNLPLDVIVFYGALLVWAVLLARGWKRGSYGGFIAFGVLLLVALNARYAIDGAARSIAFFVGIYDVLHNLGVSDPAQAAALVPCAPGQECSVWEQTYSRHPSWGVAFYERFAQSPQPRTGLLYAHIFFNSLAFVLMTVQLYRPGNGSNPGLHRTLGYVSLLSLLIGVACASMLAAEHGSVAHYGGHLAMLGFWFMALCVCTCAVMGLAKIRRRDFVAHRIWMFRYAGSMWGAFWLFRVMEFVLGPLLRNHDTVSILLCIWASAPLGILIAEWLRRRSVRPVPVAVHPDAGPTGAVTP